ncbi:hypothetical protein [Oribacterium sinus]
MIIVHWRYSLPVIHSTPTSTSGHTLVSIHPPLLHSAGHSLTTVHTTLTSATGHRLVAIIHWRHSLIAIIHWGHSHAIITGRIAGEVIAIPTGESTPISGHSLHTVWATVKASVWSTALWTSAILTTLEASAGGTALWTSAILSSILSAVKASV